ncbi:hemerythrin domain-containing protein [Erythrobacter sp. KMU-140]|uniref:Hemerythrin domain-containing protein n=2 Tax=Erythrobacter rubeus TaxID=2760803 RepID=A0ABR8KUG8_9SPHN|nr:hemerythrin domain-containing protein [Erythrobacter rubeus]
MPEAFRILLNETPRDSWETHPSFKTPTRNWLGAHRMFRRLAETIRTTLETHLENRASFRTTVTHLSYYGDALVRNLHGHHNFEDTSYFPELRKADPRFAGGLEILERDHEILDRVLHDFTQQANGLITQFQNNVLPGERPIADIHQTSLAIERLLQRHLADEEELAVPIILHHRLRG